MNIWVIQCCWSSSRLDLFLYGFIYTEMKSLVIASLLVYDLKQNEETNVKINNFSSLCTLPFPVKSIKIDLSISSPFWRRSALGFLWKEWCWSWNSSTLATSREELTHWKSLWCWEGLGAGGEGDDRGWDGWMASLTLWTWVWVNSGS